VYGRPPTPSDPRIPNLPRETAPPAAETTALGSIERSPLTVLHLLVVGLCAVGFAMDFVEIALGNGLAAIFSAPPHSLKGATLSWLLSSVYVGAIAGAPLAGWLADRFGPRKTLTWTVAALAVTSLLAGLSPTSGTLSLARLLSGCALGAYPPLMMAYLTDILPQRRRGALIFTVCAIAYLAPPAALFALRSLTADPVAGVEGWRWLFLAAAAMCAASWGVSLLAPEAPHWLDARGRRSEVLAVGARFANSRDLGSPARKRDARAGVADGHDAKPALTSVARPVSPVRFLVLCLVYFLIPWAGVAFPLLTGPILLARHINLSDTLFYVALATFGPALGALAGGGVIDRMGRRPMMAACVVVMALSTLVFFSVPGFVPMAASIIVFGVGSALYLPALTTYSAELFAPAVRGRATSIAWAANRVGAALSPALLLPLIQAGRSSLVLAILGLTLIANLIAIAATGLKDRKTPGTGAAPENA
jgi:putative MFS transporter